MLRSSAWRNRTGPPSAVTTCRPIGHFPSVRPPAKRSESAGDRNITANTRAMTRLAPSQVGNAAPLTPTVNSTANSTAPGARRSRRRATPREASPAGLSDRSTPSGGTRAGGTRPRRPYISAGYGQRGGGGPVHRRAGRAVVAARGAAPQLVAGASRGRRARQPLPTHVGPPVERPHVPARPGARDALESIGRQ